MTHRRLGALAALVLVVVAACSPGPGSGGILEGTKWVLNAVAVGGVLTVVPETEYADAEFTSRQVSGFAGCNTFDASYRAGGRTLFVTRPRTTLMACPEPALGLEQAYLNALENSRFYTARADNLTIYDGDRNTILTFDAAPRNPLLGKWLVAGYGTPPSTVNGILPGTELDVAFGIVAIGGSAGCNTFSGTYGTNGDIVRVSQLATTRLACEQPIMDQETAFLAALQGVARIDSQGPRVNLEDRDGHALVQLVRPSEVEPEASASPSAVPSASARAERERQRQADGHADPEAHGHAHAQADGRADPEAHRRADGHADDGARALGQRVGPAELPADRHLRPVARRRRRGRRQPRLPGLVVHARGAAGARVPLLRPG